MTVLPARSAQVLVAPQVAPGVRRRVVRRIGPLLVAMDMLAATVAMVAAVLATSPALDPRQPTLVLGGLLVAGWLAAIAVTGEYRRVGAVGPRVRRLLAAALVVPTVVLVLSDMAGPSLPAPIVAATAALAASIGILGRIAVVAAARRGLPVTGIRHRVVLVGVGATLPSLVERIERSARDSLDVVGACIVGGASTGLDHLAPTHGLAACLESVRASAADAVVVVPHPSLSDRDVQRLRWALEEHDIDLFVWAGVHDAPAGRTTLDMTATVPLLHVSQPRRLGPTRQVKQVLDPLLALTGLLVLAPLLLAVAIAIRIDSPGPAFYRQVRVGKDDQRFRIWKFRTMSVDADQVLAGLSTDNEVDGPLFKMRRDPRVTRIGRWLRRTSIDELPQLFNVVLGQMSLVGPRPALPAEVSRYPSEVRHRLVVPPGITGLWQVSGRSDLSWEDAVRLDQRYVDDWSLGLDVQIMVRTVSAVFRGTGAY